MKWGGALWGHPLKLRRWYRKPVSTLHILGKARSWLQKKKKKKKPLFSFPVDAAEMPSGVGVSPILNTKKLKFSFDVGGMGYGCLECV